jgi:hypothetical protein
MSPCSARPARIGLALLIGLGALLEPARPSSASIPERTDAVPTPALNPGFPVLTGGTFSLPPQFVDLDLDGKHEILAVTDQGTIFVVGSLGKAFGSWPKSIGQPLSGPPAVGDVNLDGVPDIVLLAKTGLIRVFTGSGAAVMSATIPGTPVGGPVLAELNRTGRLSILAATTNGKLHAVAFDGSVVPGFPVTGPGPAVGGAFTFIAGDNQPRVGYLADPGGAAIYFMSGAPDAPYSYNPGVPLGQAMPVSGPRAKSFLSDIDELYLAGRGGQLWRFDPEVIVGMGGDPVPLAPAAGDSIVDTPCLVDVNGDLVPELALRSLNGGTLSIRLVDGEAGVAFGSFPKTYAGSAPGGAIVAADLGEGGTPELVFNHGGDKVSCLKVDGTLQWTLSGLVTAVGPALGDLEGDGAMDLAVVTTNGGIHSYTLGNAGVGPKGIEWPNHDGTADHARRHHLRDRAAVRPQWPAALSPPNAFTTRPVLADVSGDGLPEAIWSDYLSSKTYVWGQATDSLTGFPQTYTSGAIQDAPAVGDVTGDGIDEVIQSTANGYLVWGTRTGVKNSMLIDNNRILTPPGLADLNADGVLDVVVGSSSGRLYAANLITKTLLPGFPVTTAGAILLPPALGDVNGDGQTDIVVVANVRYITAYGRTGVAALAGWPRQFPSGNTLTQPILLPVAGNAGLAVAFGSQRVDSTFAYLVGGNSANKAGWPVRFAGNAIFGPIAGDFDNDNNPDVIFSTSTDSMYVLRANGGRAFARFYDSAGDVEVTNLVDLDLDQRPDIVAMSDHSTMLGMRFNGLLTRSFDRLTFFTEAGQPPAFGDLGNDGAMEMALSDLGQPILYSFGFGSWGKLWSPWPMKGHDARRTHALSGTTVVGAEDPGPALAALGWARAMPNPAAGRVTLAHSRPLRGRFEAAIYDLRGRLVRRIAAGEAPVGAAAPSWTWDGTDEHGSATVAGVYFYRVVDAEGALSTRVVRLR